MGYAITQSQLLLTRFRTFIVRRDFLLAVCVGLIVIGVGTYLGQENNNIVPINNVSLARYTAEPTNPLSFLSNWDGPNYIQISQHGYTSVDQTNFFPFYPTIVHIFHLFISSPLISAIVVSWLSFIGAIYCYLKVLKLLFHIKDNIEALKGVLLFVLFPSGIFLLATYTESLFAFLALAALYYALKKEYLPAAFLTLFATLTHFNGIFLLILIVMVLYEQKETIAHIVIAAGIGSLGLLSYMDYLFVKYQNPFAFVSAQQAHGWLQHNYSTLVSELDIVNILLILLILIAAYYWWSRRKSFSVYLLLYLCIPVFGGQIGGFDRYALMAFPVQFMLFDRYRDRLVSYAMILSTTAILWTHYVFLYSGGYIGG